MNLDDIGWSFYGTKESLWQVYNLAESCKNIPGDFVECGIAAGSGIMAMKRAAPNKTVWGFDSFKGIQFPSEQDKDWQIPFDPNRTNKLESSCITVCDYQFVTENLGRFWKNWESEFILIQGWVQETIPCAPLKQISLLRLDMDLYDPTLHCLKHLFPLLSKGGVLIIDDGNLAGVNTACEEYFESIGYSLEWILTERQNPKFIYK